MKRVLFVLHLPGPIHGASMVGKFIRDSEEVNGAFDCHYINMTTARTLEDIGKGGVRKYWQYLCLLVRVAFGCVRLRPDVVYLTPNSAGAPFYKDWLIVQIAKMALWLSMCRKTVVVLHFHNKGVALRQERRLDDWLYRRFFRGVKVILLAEQLYEDIMKYVGRRDVLVCENGIPQTSPLPLPRGEDCGEVELLFLSNLLVAKGVWVMLDALQMLVERGQRFNCSFVGGETAEIDRTLFEAEAERRGLTSCVHYLGKRYGEEKAACFRRADMFVLPSFTEAFPLTVLEAMQYGLPVVASCVGGIPAQVSHGVNGLLCQPQDSACLADCLVTLIADREMCRRMGRAGRQLYEQRFTLEAFEHRFVQTINDAISR